MKDMKEMYALRTLDGYDFLTVQEEGTCMKEIENIDVSDYKIEIEKVDDDGGGYIAIIPALGCIGDGSTEEEAIADVREVAKNLIEIAKEDGKAIPQKY